MAQTATVAGKGKGRGGGRKGQKGAEATNTPAAPEEESALRTTLNHAIELLESFEQADTAAKGKKGTYNSARKTAIKLGERMGFQSEDIGWYIDNHKRKPEEIDAETRRRTKLAKYMDLPIGSQLGMLENGNTVATAIEDDKAEDPKVPEAMTPDALMRSGAKHHRLGHTREDCPYPPGVKATDGKDACEHWFIGFDKNADILKQQGSESVTKH